MIHRFEVEDRSLAFMATARVVLEGAAARAEADDRLSDAEVLRKLSAARPCSHVVAERRDESTVTVDGAQGFEEDRHEPYLHDDGSVEDPLWEDS